MNKFHFLIVNYNTSADLLNRCIYSIKLSILALKHKEDRNKFTLDIADDASKVYEADMKPTIQFKKNCGGVYLTRCKAIEELKKMHHDTNSNHYIIFIDADDTVDLWFCSELIKVSNSQTELVDMYEVKRNPVYFIGNNEFDLVGRKEMRYSTNKREAVFLRHSVTGRAIRWELFDQALKHPELKCFFGDDQLIMYQMYDDLNKIVLTNAIYYYSDRNEKPENEDVNYRSNEENHKKMKKLLDEKLMELYNNPEIKTQAKLDFYYHDKLGNVKPLDI
jgi:hypothetical protein